VGARSSDLFGQLRNELFESTADDFVPDWKLTLFFTIVGTRCAYVYSPSIQNDSQLRPDIELNPPCPERDE
jgi:hypothetical protein